MKFFSRRENALLQPVELDAELDRVSYAVDGKTLLREVSLRVRAGEVLAVVGPNGAGKSTTLGLLAGDLRPESGRVLVAGKELGTWSGIELARLRSVLPQQNTVTFPFTVAEVVRMGRTPWEGTEAEDFDETEIAAALKATGMTEFAERRFTTLSGGEQARAALSRVLAQRAGVLLLDEPTAALDLRHSEEILGLATARAGAGDAVLVVLHDLGLAAAYADRVAVLSEGELAAEGTPAEVLTESLLSEVYRHPVEVLTHPRTGKPIVLPHRAAEERR
ncbi:heme ABC transporter ATP-binding protein [Amycolatopsis umgeniensis]|uniref:Iron complex transport system ATP-binding protein n=1 Tax=Amycolatopsis umgeniensis TaxID=336628 RepID=A0A841B3Y5_9PSEU|nr:heme ABC transporter ATP-binding protein [Amycolatopsis umgeniensis]MBB5853204.1 iron complex transport system ATP-binding protein [Amycolatopsis umgeniensis]